MFGINSFRYQAAKLRNALPEETRKITDFNTFKAFIGDWGGADCRCVICRYVRDFVLLVLKVFFLSILI